MIRAILAAALILAGCATPAPRSHEVTCNLDAISFWLTEASDSSAQPVTAWHSSEPIWLSEPAPLSGRDLASFRVVEAPSRIFRPGELKPGDPEFDWSSRPLVPSIELEFTSAGAESLYRVQQELTEQRKRAPLTSSRLAVLLNQQLLVAPRLGPPGQGPEAVQRIELTSEAFSDVVSHVRSALGCS